MKNIELGKCSFLFVLCLWTTNLLFAQSIPAKIVFSEEAYNFGNINEAEGEVSHSFYAINISTDTLYLQSVKASCGCTTPYWDDKAVLQGDSAKIIIAFNPINRPGKFNKSITVQTNLQPAAKMLYISGYVVPEELRIEDHYPTRIGGIRFESKFLNFGTITNNSPVTKTFNIFNQSADTITFSDSIISGEYITVQLVPAAVPAKRSGKMRITYDPTLKNDLGFFNEPIVLFTNEEEESNKALNIVATILEYFPPMTDKELEKEPKISLDETEYDFSSVNTGEVLEHIFTITNNGKKNLMIRAIKTSCPCLTVEIDDETIKSGKEQELKVLLNTTDRQGPQIKRVTIFSNDPTRSAMDVVIKAYVKED